jgi:hypothetical protein
MIIIEGARVKAKQATPTAPLGSVGLIEIMNMQENEDAPFIAVNWQWQTGGIRREWFTLKTARDLLEVIED